MKKILAMILALSLVAGLAACKHDTQDNTTENMTESTAALETTEPSSEATEPSSEATEPSSEATEPSTEPTEPTEEPAGITMEEVDGQRHYYLADGTQFCTDILDDTGNLIRREAYLDGELYRVWKYEYTDDGDLGCVRFLYDVDGDDWGWQYGGDTMVTQITDRGLEDIFYEDGVISAVVSHTTDWILLREERYEDGLLVFSDEYDSVVTETHYEKGMPCWSIRYGDVDEAAFYDEQGRMIQQFGFEAWEEIWCRSFTYDEAGNLIDETLVETADNESVDERKRYTYDGDRVRAYSAKEGLCYSARYDELGRIQWESYGCPYGVYGEYTDYTYYEYNDDGSYRSTWVGATSGCYYRDFDKDGNLLDHYGGQDPGEIMDLLEMENWEHYEYNEYGDRISLDEYEFGELKSSCRFEYVYDEGGNWIEMVSYQDGEQAARTFRTYDDQGRVTEERSESGGYRCTYTYDDAGNLTEMQEMWGDETDIYTYIYDESGRLTQEIRRSISD